jgi:putative addiction module component (TIGR02574 family)
MKTAIGRVRKEALSLSASERASLAHDIIISLDDPSSFYLGDDYESEIQRRVKSVKQGKSTGRPAEQVFSEMARLYK